MCRSVMIVGMTSDSMVTSMIKEAFDNGWGDGYEDGCNCCEEIMKSQIDIEIMKLNIMREKYFLCICKNLIDKPAQSGLDLIRTTLANEYSE